MPAAAVIPAPIAYIKVVAVKKLVVGFRDAPIKYLLWSVKRPGGVARAMTFRCGRCVTFFAGLVRRVLAGALKKRGVPDVSTGPPVPSFWIPVPAIDLVGAYGTLRPPLSVGVCALGACARARAFLGPRSFTVKKLECSKQAFATEYNSMG